MSRKSVNLDDQLCPLDLSEKEFNRAIGLWKAFAKEYGLPPEKLRLDDRIADIVRTDFFGDQGLYFEKLLTNRGIKPFPSEVATLEYLIRQLI